ncbi:hypothetical protein NDA10_003512 [Ustilago hordei]|nr:hypothetical protein NDA10_003512 [Ustilago hordei]
MSVPYTGSGGVDHITTTSNQAQTGSAFKELPSSHPSSPDADHIEKTRSNAASANSNEPPAEDLRRALQTRHMAWLHHGNSLNDLPFRAWLAPYGTWGAFILNVVLAFFQGYTTFLNPRKAADIIVAYIVIPVAVALYFGWKLYHRTKIVSLDDIDLDTGRRLIEDFEEPTAADDDLLVEKKPWYKRPAKVISRVLAFALVSSLFFVWGLSYGLLDSLNKTFQDSLHLTKAQSTGLQACYFGAYFVNGPISGPLARKYGYRFSIHGGLGLFSIGTILFWPCAVYYSYPGFLVCTFVTASGLAWLEMAANSYITVLGPPQNASFRLVLAQSWNGVASIFGPIIAGRTFLKTGHSHILNHLQWVYLGIAGFGCVINFLLFIAKLPEVKQEVDASLDEKPVNIWNQRHLLYGAFAEFMYVGSQVAVASLTINFYVEQPDLNTTVTRAADLFSVTLAVFTIGRFTGVPILSKVDSALMLFVCGLGCVFMSILTAVVPGVGGIACLMLIFFFESVCYPIIFTLSTSNLGVKQKLGSALVAAGVSGGAWYPSVQAVVADATSTRRSFFVPIAGFAVVAWYGLYMHMRGCRQQGYWSWRKLDKVTAMGVASQRVSDAAHTGSDKDIKVDQCSPTYETVPYGN